MPSDKDDAIFKVQTVPPPPGSTDAYSAPTRVGEMAASVLDEMIVAAKRNAEQHAAAPEPATTLHPEPRMPVPTLPAPAPALPTLTAAPPAALSLAPATSTAPSRPTTRSGWHIVLRVTVVAALLLLLAILGGAAFLLLRR